MRVYAYNVLSSIALRSKENRDSVLNVLPLRLYIIHAIETKETFLESMISMFAFVMKYALDIKEADMHLRYLSLLRQ